MCDMLTDVGFILKHFKLKLITEEEKRKEEEDVDKARADRLQIPLNSGAFGSTRLFSSL